MPTLYSRTGHTQVDKAVRPAAISVSDSLSRKSNAMTQPDDSATRGQVEPSLQFQNETDIDFSQEDSADVASQQTHFAEDLSIEGYNDRGPVLAPTESDVAVSFWKKHQLPLLASGLALMVIFTIALFLPRSSEIDQDIVIAPTPTTEAQRELSVLQRELILLEKDIEQADPLQAKLAFPPVNFTLKLDDATTLEQNQRSPLR